MSCKIIYAFIFLPVIAFLGIITTWEDFKTSKIRNKWVLLGLVYSAAAYLFVLLMHSLGAKGVYGGAFQRVIPCLIWNFDKWCINLIVSILVAYILWHYKMWGGGDAKLFICFCALVPMGQYSKVYFQYYFASFFLLLMIFMPASIFLFLRSCFFLIRRYNSKELLSFTKEKMAKIRIKNVLNILFGFFVLFLFFSIVRQKLIHFIGRFLPYQLAGLIVLLIFGPFARFFKKNANVIFWVFIFLVVYLFYTRGLHFSVLINNLFMAAIIMMIFPIFKKITDLYIERTARKTTPFAIWEFVGVMLTWFWR